MNDIRIEGVEEDEEHVEQVAVGFEEEEVVVAAVEFQEEAVVVLVQLDEGEGEEEDKAVVVERYSAYLCGLKIMNLIEHTTCPLDSIEFYEIVYNPFHYKCNTTLWGFSFFFLSLQYK